MSEDAALREAARERLFEALLGEVAEEPRAVRPIPRRRGERWLVAAGILLGLLALAGTAWLRRAETAAAQDGGRWYEHYWPFDWNQGRKEPDRVPLDWGDAEAFQAALARSDLRELCIVARSKAVVFDAATWQALAAMPRLEALALPEGLAFDLDSLRELRRAPNLRALAILGGDAVLDSRLAATLAELPKLGMLSLSSVKLTPEGMRGLAGLPHLEVLTFERAELDEATMQAIGKLRTLRALGITSMGWMGGAHVALTAANVRGIAQLARLERLGLNGFLAADARLDLLPDSLRDVRICLDGMPSLEQQRALAGLPRLQHLYLSPNAKMSPAEAAAFRALFRAEVKVELPE